MTNRSETRRRTLVLATNNSGKVQELARLLAALPLEVISASQALGKPFHVDETGSSFRDNAVLKARAAAEATGHWALADDSGLEVDALGGRPGVWSARYAGEGASDADNNARLLQELSGVEHAARTARFRCVIALAKPGGQVETVSGEAEGLILQSPRGDAGFGYDPLFEVPRLGLTFAELTGPQKDALSHRGQALEKLVAGLLNQLSSQ